MGLKDLVDWVSGRKPNKKLGSRRSPDAKRGRDESTVQIQSPIAGRAPGTPPLSSHPSPVAPPSAGTSATAAAPPPSRPPPPPVASPPPYTAAPRATQAPARPRADSGEATQYVAAPKITQGKLTGVLVGISGQLEGEIHKIFDRDMRVGRAETSDVKLLDPKISREHAKIVAVDGDLMIVPMNDKNPIYVNDRVVEEAEQISDGDKLQFGNPGASVFRFRTIEGQ